MATDTVLDAPLVTRVGLPSDIDEIMALAIMASHENGFLSPSPEKLLRGIYPALCQDHGIVGVVGPEGGPIQGAVLLHVNTHWYSDEQFLEEKSVFVHPDFRKAAGGRAARLVEFSKKAADTLGMPLLIGVLSSNRTEAKVRMYRRLLGEPQGAFFLYNGGTGPDFRRPPETEHG